MLCCMSSPLGVSGRHCHFKLSPCLEALLRWHALPASTPPGLARAVAFEPESRGTFTFESESRGTFTNALQEARAAASDAQRRFDAAGFEVQALREQCAGMEASANERVERCVYVMMTMRARGAV
eukprot:scaffold279903_cov14-Tisochrysis_lutea.AAC.1